MTGKKTHDVDVGKKTHEVDPGFCDFVATRSAALFRTAVLITGDRAAAEDLVQDVLEKAFKNWDRVAAADAPEAYVRRIMANLVNDRWRRRGRGPSEHELLDHDRPTGSDDFHRVEARDAVIRALRTLPVGMRAVLVLRYFDDMSEAQTAAALGLSTGTVKSQTFRGMAKLRDALADADRDADLADRPSPAEGRVFRLPEGGEA